jgi:hypothetical protein
MPIIQSPGAGEVFYFDGLGLWEGAGGVWANGGERIDPSTLGFYWDESVGRRLFVWDTVNNRWQMVFGDTGWRDVSSLMTTPAHVQTLTSLLMRRVGNVVHLTTRGTVGTGTLAGTANGMGLINLPSGFQPNDFCSIGSGVYNYRTPTIISSASSKSAIAMQIAAGNNWGASVFDGAGSWLTSDAWPSALPGSASGSIPSV